MRICEKCGTSELGVNSVGSGGFSVYNTSTKVCDTLCETCYEKLRSARERFEPDTEWVTLKGPFN
jgi:hypothetical protein